MNYLDCVPGSFSIEPVGTAETLKRYVSGERLCRRVFKIALRSENGRQKNTNVTDAQKMEKLAVWLCENAPKTWNISIISMPEAEYSVSSATRISLTAEVIYNETGTADI